jgi:hypothetical protein
MRIEEVSNFSSDESSGEEEQATFQLIFSYREKELWHWAQTKARVLDRQIEALADSTGPKVKFITAEPTKSGQKRVGFATTNFKSVLKLLTPNPDQLQRYSLSCDQLIIDLCLEHPDNGEMWLAFQSYHDFISGQRRVFLPLEARLRLAAKAASSVLYLHHTVWLDPNWTTLSHYILLARRKDGTVEFEPCFQQKGGELEFEFARRPSKRFEPTLFVQHNMNSSQSLGSELEIPFTNSFDPTLFALGIFLIELSHNQTWSELRTRTLASHESLSDMNPHAMDLAAIEEILQPASNRKTQPEQRPFQREGPFYLEAVRGCFSGRPDLPNSSSYNRKFREMAYENVVWNLQCALQLHLNSLSSEQEFEDDAFAPSMNHTQSAQPTHFSLFDDHNVQSKSYVSSGFGNNI